MKLLHKQFYYNLLLCLAIFQLASLKTNKMLNRLLTYSLIDKSTGECNTVVSAYTTHRHLKQYCPHPSKFMKLKMKIYEKINLCTFFVHEQYFCI